MKLYSVFYINVYPDRRAGFVVAYPKTFHYLSPC
jgi:hypothetical protein